MSGQGMQEPLFGGLEPAKDKPLPQRSRLRILITVKAAPTPSARSGETVCVAGLALDHLSSHWVRLYPINFRYLEQDVKFKKYDIVEVEATPAGNDGRRESWKPDMQTLVVTKHLDPWKGRRTLLDPVVEDSMCALNKANQSGATGPSLALVRPRIVRGLVISKHPGWSHEDQVKIDAYVNQLELFDAPDKTPLEAPRLQGHYEWLCHDSQCKGHRQSIIDWEFVALQRRSPKLTDDALGAQLRAKFLTMMCRGDRHVAFFVGNQAKRHHVFHVLGVYYPT